MIDFLYGIGVFVASFMAVYVAIMAAFMILSILCTMLGTVLEIIGDRISEKIEEEQKNPYRPRGLAPDNDPNAYHAINESSIPPLKFGKPDNSLIMDKNDPNRLR